MTQDSTATVWHEVASPFCGIASDDLTIEVDGHQVRILENADPVTQKGFETPLGDTQPRVNGEAVTMEQAISQIADHLIHSQQPLIGGMGTDLNGARAAMALADKSGATMDSLYSPAAFRNILVLQDSGYMTTTLTEVRNRCDLLVVVGSDIEQAYPRFFERMIWNESSLFDLETHNRRIVYLGKKPSGDASTSPNGREAEVLACDDADLPEVISVLRALINNKNVQAETVGGIQVSELKSLADAVLAAHYSVFTWSGSLLNFDHAEATIQNLCEAIKEVNATTRSCGLPLGGKEGDTTVNAVSSWQSGYPMRTTFNRGFPDYDPFLNDARRMLDNNEVDLLIWVSSFNTEATPPKTGVPTVVLGRSGMQFETEPDIFIPVGVPGIDHEGHTFRCDSAVSLPLKKLRDSGLPSVFEVLSAVEQAL